MSTPPNDSTDPTTPKPEESGDEKQRQDPLGPQGKLKVAQFRNRSGILAVVLAIVTIATIVFILWNLASSFSQWDPTGWLFTIVVALVGTVPILLLVWRMPKWQVDRYRERLQPKDQVELEIQARSTLIQIIGGVAVLASIFFTARNLQLTAQNVQTTENNLKYARSTQIAERYAKAIEQLKDKDNFGVRLAGIYTLGILASQEEAKEFREPIILVLAAHVKEASRLPEDYNPETDTPNSIAPDIQAILTIIGRQKAPELKLNFHATNLRAADFQGGHFENVDFGECYLSGANFNRAKLDQADFGEANLRESSFDEAVMKSAKLTGANLTSTSFKGANLESCNLTLATVSETTFNYADLKQADFGGASGSGWFKDVNLSAALNYGSIEVLQ
jgi:uncharacterized protein YjbI with pentapeptide repeats